MGRRWPVGDDSRGGAGKALVWLGIAAGVGLVLLATFAIWWDTPRIEAPDLEPAPLPPLTDAENGVVPFENLNVTEHARLSEAWKLLHASQPGYDPRPPEWDHELANAVLSHHTDLLAAIDEALARPGFRFRDRGRQEGNSALRSCQLAADLKRLEAWSRFHSGDHEGAVRSAIDLAILGRRITEDNGSLSDWMRGTRMATHGTGMLLELLSRTNDRLAHAAVLDSREAWRLSREDSAAAYRRAAGVGFRAWSEQVDRRGWDTMTSRSPDPSSLSWRSLFVKPNVTVALQAELIREAIANVDRPPADWQFAVTEEVLAFPEGPLDSLDLNYYGWLALAQSAQGYKGLLYQDTRLEMLRTFAVLAPALRLHEMDHGALPETLDTLTPTYLPGIPTDPYNGKALRYDPASRQVWSVGNDFTDAPDETFELSPGTGRQKPTLIVPEP